MRRQRVLRASSALNLCFFCACRLGAQVPPSQVAPLISPAPRRNFNSRSTTVQQSAATAAVPSNDHGPASNDPPSFVFDPNSSLTLTEQKEKARRIQSSREAQAREQELKQKQIWEQEEARRKAAERNAAADSSGNSRRGQQQRDGRNNNDGGYSMKNFSLGSSMGSAVEGQSIGRAMAVPKPKAQDTNRAQRSTNIRRQAAGGKLAQEDRNSPFNNWKARAEQQQASSKQQAAPKKKALPSIFSSAPPASTPKASSVSGWGAGGTETLPISYGDASQKSSAVTDVPQMGEPEGGFVRKYLKEDQSSDWRAPPEPEMRQSFHQKSFRPQHSMEEPLASEMDAVQQDSYLDSHGSANEGMDAPEPQPSYEEATAPPRRTPLPFAEERTSPASSFSKVPEPTPAPSANLGSFGYFEEPQEDDAPLQRQPQPARATFKDVTSDSPEPAQSRPQSTFVDDRPIPRPDTLVADQPKVETPAKASAPQDDFEFFGFGIESDERPEQSVQSSTEARLGQGQESNQAQLQASRTHRKQAPSDSVYRVTPYDPAAELQTEPRSNAVDNSAHWQHLQRRPVEQPPPPPMPAQGPPPQSAGSFFDDEDWVDRKFEEHLQARAYQPPPPAPVAEERDSRQLSDFHQRKADRQCARCGEKGHIARECTGPMKCYACGGSGHSARDCPNNAGRSRQRKVFDDPFEGERAPRAAQTQSSRRRRMDDPFSKPHVEQVVRPSRDDFDQPPAYSRRQREDGSRRSNPFEESESEPTRYNDRSQRSQQTRMDRQDDTYTAPAPTPYYEEYDETSRRQEARASRRSQKWADAEDYNESDRSSRYAKDKKERRSGRRDLDEDNDEEAGAREEYRARKAERQAEEMAARATDKKAMKQEKKAKKAGQTTPITLPEWTSVQQLSQLLGVRYEQFVERLEELGYDDIFPGKTLNSEISGMIAMEYNFEPTFNFEGHEEVERDLKAQPEPEDKESLPTRPPVVTIMGHVDHGKTTILDHLRKSSVAAGEAGGITQHIGAFSVPLAASGKTVTFLDTPGHAAFLAMRQRGANVTDIVILVVAADDSVKPQTLEALKHAKAAGVPMIVAINKVDKEGADIQRCKQDLARHGVEIEDFGGETQVVCVSGKTGQGMDELEENVVTLSEILDHRAETEGVIEGWVLEATTKKAGRVATVLVRRGTLRPGSVLVAGKTWTRVRTLRNEGGMAVREVGPGMPVEVDGWRDQPTAGDEVLQTETEQQATSVVDFRLEKAEREKIAQDTEAINETRRLDQERREKEKAAEFAAKRAASASPEDEVVSSTTGQESVEEQQSGQMTVPFIIKADVSGSAEAVSAYILSVSNPLITPQILSSEVGAVHESDIDLAHAASGHIIAFNLPPHPEMKALAEHRGVKILENNIIYRVLDDVREVLEHKLPPIVTQRVLGEAEIAMEFEIGLGGRKKLKIAGCKVRNGVVSKGSRVRVTRKGEKVYEGTITSLKNVKKDVQEMRKGTECGMGFEGWEGFQPGDQIQTFMEVEERMKL